MLHVPCDGRFWLPTNELHATSLASNGMFIPVNPTLRYMMCVFLFSSATEPHEDISYQLTFV